MTEPSTIQLVRLAQIVSGGTPSKGQPAYWRGPIPWLTPKDMARWDGSTEESVSPEAIGNGTRLAPEGTIFIAVRGMSLHNEIRIIRSQVALTFNQDIKAIVPRTGVDGLFLYYALLAKKPELLGNVEAAGHGTGRLPTDKLEALAIPDLPSSQQRGIGAVLGALDRKIELKRQMNDSLQAMARAIFKSWFIDFEPIKAKMEGASRFLGMLQNIFDRLPVQLIETELGRIPAGWEPVTIADIAEYVNGKAFTKHATGQGRMIIRIAELNSGPGGATKYSDVDAEPQHTAYPDDILFAWSGSLDVYRWHRDEGVINQHIFKVIPNDRPRWYVYYRLAEAMPFFQGIAANKATTMGHIKRGHLSDATFAEPPTWLIEAADELIRPIYDLVHSNERQSFNLARMRDALLPRLISGAIRVPDNLAA